MWSARKHDPDASEEIAVRHGAQADSGRYHKLLLPKQALAEIQKIVSEARQEHYFMTLPWGDDGCRVLPASTTYITCGLIFPARHSQLDRFSDPLRLVERD
jgi:hypothetical protein